MKFSIKIQRLLRITEIEIVALNKLSFILPTLG